MFSVCLILNKEKKFKTIARETTNLFLSILLHQVDVEKCFENDIRITDIIKPGSYGSYLNFMFLVHTVEW